MMKSPLLRVSHLRVSIFDSFEYQLLLRTSYCVGDGNSIDSAHCVVALLEVLRGRPKGDNTGGGAHDTLVLSTEDCHETIFNDLQIVILA